MEIFKKMWKGVLKIWKDPVWSKVIAAGIILLISTLWIKYSKYSFREVYEKFIEGLTYKIPVFAFLSLIALYFIVKLLRRLFKKKFDPIWDEQVGNYKFKELYQVLSNQNLPVGTKGMSWAGRQAPKEDLLTMFYTYVSFYNRGLKLDDNLDDGGYLYGVLAPKLVSYGLIDKIESKNPRLDMIDIKYQTSELGHKFHALLEKTIHLNPKNKKKASHQQSAKRQ